MNDSQKSKRKFRQSREWKSFRAFIKRLSGGKDLITLKPLRKGYQIHHRNLDERQYQNLREDWFLPCNNLTHKVLHWLYTYFQKDEGIIDRLKAEMLKMKEINGGRNGD